MTWLLTRSLLALLASSPLSAQTVRVTSALPLALGAPAGIRFVLPAAATVTPLPLSAVPLNAAALTPILPAAAEPAKFATTNAAPSAAIEFADLATPADGWASRFNFQPGAQFFDGGRSLKSDTGATFVAVVKGQGTVRVHIVERAPIASARSVPGTEGLSGKALLDALNTISGKSHTQQTYRDASDYMFSKADQVVINGVKGVVDGYSGIFVAGTSKEGKDYPEPGDSNGDGFPDREGMNVEHTWPQSLFQKGLPMRSDLHHLMATFMHPNSVRGHLPFGEVRGRADYKNKAGAKRGGGMFEPPDAVKGRVARGLLYFYSRYKDSRMFGRTSVVFWNRQIELMLKWNRDFPPDAFEARRNDLVESFQGNRNPFIDDHLLADRVGAYAFRAGNPSRGADFAPMSGKDARPSRRHASRR